MRSDGFKARIAFLSEGLTHWEAKETSMLQCPSSPSKPSPWRFPPNNQKRTRKLRKEPYKNEYPLTDRIHLWLTFSKHECKEFGQNRCQNTQPGTTPRINTNLKTLAIDRHFIPLQKWRQICFLTTSMAYHGTINFDTYWLLIFSTVITPIVTELGFEMSQQTASWSRLQSPPNATIPV